MTKKALLSKLIILLLFVSFQATTHAYYSVDDLSLATQGESIQVWTSPSLYPMVSYWANEYNLDNNNTRIEVSSLTTDQVNEGILDNGSIGFLSAYQLSSFKRLLDIYSTTAKTIDALMKLELPSGVEVEIKV